MKFNIVVCGGTFDHLHKGHKEFLRFAFSQGKNLIIGLTSNKYLKNSKLKTQNSKFIELYRKRKGYLLSFLKKERVLDRTKVVKIDDVFGPTLDKNLHIDAIIVSKDTVRGAELINKKRKELGLEFLKVFVCPFARGQDREVISSTKIKRGEINREGDPYVNPLWFKKNLALPENLRKEFKKPFGKLFKKAQDSFKNINSLVITVGDVTAKIFNEKSLGQNISVIDFKVARKQKFSNILELGFAGDEIIFKVNNPAGNITSSLFKKLSEVFKSNIKGRIILQINGVNAEEDLAVLPIVLLSPLNTVIYYGQPGKGIVRIAVSEASKNKAYNLISKLKFV